MGWSLGSVLNMFASQFRTKQQEYANFLSTPFPSPVIKKNNIIHQRIMLGKEPTWVSGVLVTLCQKGSLKNKYINQLKQ